MHLKGLEPLLYTWASWMSQGGSIETGYPKEIFYFVSAGKTHSEDFWDDIEINIATVMDTIINDLPDLEKAAIYFKYLGQRYPYDSSGYNYVDKLDNAYAILSFNAEKKGIL